jgi:hypothetical protein
MRENLPSWFVGQTFQGMKKLVFPAVLALLVSCGEFPKQTDALGENAEIVGTWVEEGYEDDVTLLARSLSLDSAKYGFIIREDGTFVERKNAGWYATPPIAFENFEGTWEALSDSLLEITVGFWGGTLSYQMRVVFLNQQELGIRYLYADNRAESR